MRVLQKMSAAERQVMEYIWDSNPKRSGSSRKKGIL